jgi:NAD(P)-dependent dehydrogenase (short-subunit alcohol dehydrogenase family)
VIKSQSSLAHKVCLIAGTTGIGAATAELAAAAGARICLTGKTPAHGEQLRDRLRALNPACDCEFICADLTAESAPNLILESCVRRFGGLDAAFNVAGISGRRFGDGPAHECTPEGWDAVMNTNARGMFLLCGAILRQMLRQPAGPNGLRGTILNMASVLGWAPSPKHFSTHAYAASKAAIIGFSRAMAAHYAADRIRINVIAPALVRTPMSQRAQHDPAMGGFIRTKQPLVGGFIEAHQVARAALFLMGDESDAITGDVLTVDAGWCLSDGQG